MKRVATCTAVLLAAASAQNQPCTDPTTYVGGQNMEQFMSHFTTLLENSLGTVYASTPEFATFMETTKQCQSTCMTNVMQTSMQTMWQTGQIMDEDQRYDLAKEALTGAFKACYPRPDREAVKKFMDEVVNAMSTPVTTAAPAYDWGGRRLQQVDACPQSTTSGDGKTFVDTFISAFPSAMTTALAENAVASEFFASSAYACQSTCAQSVLTAAVANFYETGLSADTANFNTYVTDLVTGGMKACYPRPPREDMATLVGAVIPLITTASVSTAPACIPDTTLQSGMTKADFLGSFNPTLKTAVEQTVNNDPAILEFMQTTLECQMTCLFDMMDLSVSTLWSTGALFAADHVDVGIEALTGAMKACYPRPPRDDVLKLVTAVVNSMTTGGRRLRGTFSKDELNAIAAAVSTNVDASKGERRLQSPGVCSGDAESTEGSAWIGTFMDGFPGAFMAEIDKSPAAKQYFTETVKQCQNVCAPTAIRAAIVNLWETGMIMDATNQQAWTTEVVTGAMKTCYPRAPSDDILAMVTSMMAGVPSWPSSQTSKACMADTALQGTPAQDKDAFMASFKPILQTALQNAAAANADFATFMNTQTKTCQEPCMFSIIDESIETLWGTGQLFDESVRLDALHQALTGSFKACYPHPDRAFVLDLMQSVVTGMNGGGRRLGFEPVDVAEAMRKAAAIVDREIPEQHTDSRRLVQAACAATSAETTAFVNDFMTKFPTAFTEVMQQNTAANQYFTQTVKDCQNTCAPAVMKISLETFYNAGFHQDAANRGLLMQDAVTGGLKACYPLADRTTIHTLVGDMLANLGMTRLFDATVVTDFEPSVVRFSPVAMVTAGAIAAAAVAAAAFAVIRRVRHRGEHRMLESEGVLE